MATFYAMQHTYGAAAGDERGNHIGRLAVFRTRKARDEWVADGNPFITQSGARTPLSAKGGTRADRHAIGEFLRGRDIRGPQAYRACAAWDVERERDVMAWNWFANT